MENTPIKRGRGRPRKHVPAPIIEDDPPEIPPIFDEPEEVILAPGRIDLSDLRAPTDPSVEPEPVEEEVIHLGPQPEPSAPPPPPPPPRVSPDVLEMLRAPVMQVVPEPAPVNDKAQRRELIGKVRKYREAFPAVAAMRFSEEWSTEELESHLESVRLAVSAKTTGVLVKSAYIMAVKGGEVAGCSVGLKVYGLSDLLARSSEIDQILKEIQCELPILGHIKPGHRLALATFGAALALDSANRKSEVLGTFKAAPVAEAVSSKYQDL